jgi:hypothetical protein
MIALREELSYGLFPYNKRERLCRAAGSLVVVGQALFRRGGGASGVAPGQSLARTERRGALLALAQRSFVHVEEQVLVKNEGEAVLMGHGGPGAARPEEGPFLAGGDEDVAIRGQRYGHGCS